MSAHVLISTARSQKNGLFYLLLIIPIFLFYGLFFRFLKNTPYIDDFYWYFNFIDQFDQAPTFSEKLNVFLKPYNQHRHYIQRLLSLLSILFSGELNIYFFTLLGNSILLFFIYYLLQPTAKNIAGVVFATWLFFQPVSFMNYYTFAFFNLPVLLFSLLFIRAMVLRANLLWIIFLGLLATFSNGNGLLVWVLGILLSFIKADYKHLFIFSTILITLLILFYLQNTFYLQNIQADTSRVINVKFFIDSALYFIQIHAGFLNWSAYGLSWMAIPIGVLILFLFGKILINRTVVHERSGQLYVLYFLLFLSLSMGLISVGRVSVDGLIANVIDHYRLYPCLFLGCIVYYYMTTTKLTTILQRGILLIGIGITILNYAIYLPRMYMHFSHQLADALNYSATGKWLFYPLIQGKKEYDFVNVVSDSVISKEFYSPVEPHRYQANKWFKRQIDSSQTAVTLRVMDANYLPLIEDAFFVVKCQGLTYHFPVESERFWKDLFRFRLRQPTVASVIDWKTMNEPCLSQPSTIQYAVLRGNSLTYYRLL